MTAFKRIPLLLALCSVVACSSAVGPVPIKGLLSAGDALNPDVGGRPSPVAVKVYQLQESGSFATADFFTLWKTPGAALEADLVSTTDLAIAPGTERRFTEEIEPPTRFIGVVAAFREVELSTWRAIAKLPADDLEDYALVVKVGDLNVTVHFGEAD